MQIFAEAPPYVSGVKHHGECRRREIFSRRGPTLISGIQKLDNAGFLTSVRKGSEASTYRHSHVSNFQPRTCDTSGTEGIDLDYKSELDAKYVRPAGCRNSCQVQPKPRTMLRLRVAKVEVRKIVCQKINRVDQSQMEVPTSARS